MFEFKLTDTFNIVYPTNEILNWIKLNCESFIGVDSDNQFCLIKVRDQHGSWLKFGPTHTYKFEKESDVTLFALRWS